MKASVYFGGYFNVDDRVIELCNPGMQHHLSL